MKKLFLTIVSLSLVGSTALAAKVAVVDSGTDFNHELLADKAWINNSEVPGSRVDEDRNGKVDDINGWNFVDGYGRVFVSEHLRNINPISYRLMEIIAHRQAGTITEEEDQFFRENVTNLPEVQKKALISHLNYFGQYLHGTHVAGIVAEQSPDSKILVARVFPDDPPPFYSTEFSPLMRPQGVMDWVYKLLAVVTNGTFVQVGEYLNEMEMDVANYSLGMSLPALARQFLKLRGQSDPTEEEIAAEVTRIFVQFEPEGIKWMNSAPKTLFVIAAGNDGSDNDVLPAFPANVEVDNAISVAASLGYESLGFFSNYGAKSVDVAAPGVAVVSSVPSLDNAKMLPLSGTSMAAPFVAGVAARVKDANPNLGPAEIRKILMETVDKKDWLQGKVVSAGVVNSDRAFKAADLSNSLPLVQAIDEARGLVADVQGAEQGPLNLRAFEVSEDLDEAARSFIF